MKIINKYGDQIPVKDLKQALDWTLCNPVYRLYAPEGFRRASKEEVSVYRAETSFAPELPDNGGTNPQYRYTKGRVGNNIAYECERRDHHGDVIEIMISI